MSKELVIIVTPAPRITFEVKEVTEETMLPVLQDAVDGFIEIVRPFGRCGGHLVMVVNDEGIIRNLHPNPIGAMLYGDLIAGTIVLMKEGYRNDEPDLIGFTPEECDAVMKIIGGTNNGADV